MRQLRAIAMVGLGLILASTTPAQVPADSGTPANDGAAVAAVAAGREKPGVWTQWRGPSRDGRVDAGEIWPDTLETLAQQWKVELGKGYSGPIVGSNHVYVVETRPGEDGERAVVRALERADGTEVWTRDWPSSGSVPFFAAANGDWVRSTPAYAGNLLFVGDMNEVLVALDARTGDVVWKMNFPGRFGTKIPDFGFASSPLPDGDALYVQAANSLVKLEQATGKVLWRTLNHDGAMKSSGAFSSPIVATLAGRRQLVVQSRHDLSGVDPETGELLWSQAVPNFRGMNILTPVVHGDGVFTSPYRQRSFMYGVSTNRGGFAVAERWTHESMAYMSSPVVIDGHAYVHLGNGRLECLDLQTGTVRWKTRPMGRYWSMVHQGDKILALNETGTVYLIRADPRAFMLLDSRKVTDQETWAHLAVAGDSIYVRGLEEIVAWSWPNPKPSTIEGPAAAP